MNMADMVQEIYNVVADAPSFGLIYHNVGNQSAGVSTTYTFQKDCKRAFWVGINEPALGVSVHQTNVHLSSGKTTTLLNQKLYTSNGLSSIAEVIQLDDVKYGDSVTYTYSYYHVVFVFG